MNRRVEFWGGILDSAFRLILGSIFIYSGWVKIQDPSVFAGQVAAYRLLPDVVVGLFALVLPMAEWIAGIALIATKWSRESAFLILGMLGMFFIGLVQAQIRGLKIGCGCFGGGAAEENALLTALARDVVLLLPAIWQSLRPNRWLCCRFPFLGGVLASMLVVLTWGIGRLGWPVVSDPGVSAKVAPPPEATVGEGAVPEVWTGDFPAAFSMAKKTRKPLLVFAGAEDCPYCRRMNAVLKSRSFRKWVQGTGIYLVEAHFSETNTLPNHQLAIDFVKGLPRVGNWFRYPYIGFYWPGATTNETVQGVFTGRRGEMPGIRDASLVREFASAMNVVLGNYLRKFANRPDLDAIVNASTRQINVAGDPGIKVWMNPKSGIQPLGTKVMLMVQVQPKRYIKYWLGPDGTEIHSKKGAWSLQVTDDMPEGTYTPVLGTLKTAKTRMSTSE